MYKIGEKIVYSSYGVMEIVDLREELVVNAPMRYYVLVDPTSRSGSQVFVPADNEELVKKMRPMLSRDEIYSIIRTLDDIPLLDWTPDNRARAERYKGIIEQGDRVKMISMIKLIKKTAERRVAEGKKNYLADEGAMVKAEKLLYSELATVFGIDESEVTDFVEKNRK